MSKEDNYYYSRLEGQLQYLRLVQTDPAVNITSHSPPHRLEYVAIVIDIIICTCGAPLSKKKAGRPHRNDFFTVPFAYNKFYTRFNLAGN